MLSRTITLLALMLLGTGSLFAQPTRTITDNDLVGNQTYNWSADTIYQLDGLVYLEEGGILNIEAGTRIEGLAVASNPDEKSSLIITRGAQIFAEGTAAAPIVFSAEGNDDLGADIIQDRGS
ncbi:MAG: T9SS C-terminal target domain-containing protein, partial [Bacteroidota bacterium]